MFKNILFDLDGTITDPFEGITNSVAYALRRSGITPPENEKLACFIGPPLYKSFMELYGFSEEGAARAIEYYREYYSDRGIFENKVYGGVPELLTELNERGKRIILATSKPEHYANIILKHFGLDKYFHSVAGATMTKERTEKSDVIAYALKNNGITDASSAVMVGDRKHDIIGAKQNGLRSVGVLFGYGGREELEAAGADRIIAAPLELLDIV